MSDENQEQKVVVPKLNRTMKRNLEKRTRHTKSLAATRKNDIKMKKQAQAKQKMVKKPSNFEA